MDNTEDGCDVRCIENIFNIVCGIGDILFGYLIGISRFCLICSEGVCVNHFMIRIG